MNTQTTDPPLSHEELKKKLEIRLVRIESQKANYTRAADSYRSDGIEGGALVNEMEAAKFDEEIFLLRSCLTALERGEADTRRLDWLIDNGACVREEWCPDTPGDHLRYEIHVETAVGPQFVGGCPRAAIDSAITTSNQQAE